MYLWLDLMMSLTATTALRLVQTRSSGDETEKRLRDGVLMGPADLVVTVISG